MNRASNCTHLAEILSILLESQLGLRTHASRGVLDLSFLCCLTNLQSLQVIAPFQIMDVASGLGSLKQLTTLTLRVLEDETSRGTISIQEKLSHLANLRDLSLAAHVLVFWPDAWEQLTALRSLSLHVGDLYCPRMECDSSQMLKIILSKIG